MTRAQTVLRARRRIAGGAPDWALSPEGLAALRGDGEHGMGGTKRGGEEDDQGDGEAPGSLGGASPLAGELAAIDRALACSTRVLAGGPTIMKPLRDPLIYGPDGEEGERLEAWRQSAVAVQSDSPVLAAALLWDAWETNPPLERQAWLGALLVSATLRAQRKTRAHLFCVNSALRCVRRETRRSPDRAVRLTAFLEAIAAGAAAGMKEHDRWLLARKQLEGKLKTRRSSSKLPALVEFMLARPIASAGMIAARRANHGRRPRPPRDHRARPVPGLGNLVTIFCPCRLIRWREAPGPWPPSSSIGPDFRTFAHPMERILVQAAMTRIQRL